MITDGDTRRVTITDISELNNSIRGVDRSGIYYTINLLNGPLVTLPELGSMWTVVRFGDRWDLGQPIEKPDISKLEPGDTYVSGNSLIVRNIVWDSVAGHGDFSLRELEEDLAEYQRKIAEAEQQIDNALGMIEAAQQDIATNAQEFQNDIAAARQAIEDAYGVINSTKAELQERIDGVKAVADQAKEDVDNATIIIGQVQQVVDQTEEALVDAKNRLDAAESGLQGVVSGQEQLEFDLGQAKEDLYQNQQELDGAKTRLDTAESNLAGVRTDVDAAAGEASSASQKATEAWNKGVAASDAAQAAQQGVAAIDSRGTDLVTNGTGIMESNYNFSRARFIADDAPTGSVGSFETTDTAYPGWFRTDEFIPVDASKTYRASCWVRATDTEQTGQLLFRAMFYDVDGNPIGLNQISQLNESLTTLAAPLNPGDTTITLTDASNWTAGGYHDTYLGFYDYTDSRGRTWEPGTYTRNVYFRGNMGTPQYTLDGNVLTLRDPYNGDAKPAGTYLAQMRGGDTAVTQSTGTVKHTDWRSRSLTLNGAQQPNTQYEPGTFPHGTAKIQLRFLLNYSSGLDPRKYRVGGISLSDASAASEAARAAQAAADNAQQTANAKNRVRASDSAPTGPHTVGDIWIDTDDKNHSYWWNGTKWVDVRDLTIADAASSASGAISAAQAALSAAQAAQATADGAIRTHYLPSPPWADGSTRPDSDLGDLWFDTDDGQARRWNGSSWQLIQDSTIAAALAAAQNAQSTADGKIDAYYQPTPPNGADVGDLWFDTGNQNKPHHWDGSEWVVVRDGAIEDAKTAADNAQAAADDAQTAADNAQAEAEQATADSAAAQFSANGKNQVVTSTSAAAGTSRNGRPFIDGDVWWQWDNNTNRHVIGAWKFSGGQWRPEKISDGYLASLDVNKLTVSGVARIQQLVAEKIIADAGYYDLLTVDRLTAGSGDIDELTAQKIAAATGVFMELTVGQLTAGEADVDLLTAQKLSAAIGQFLELNVGQLTAGTADVDELTAQKLAAAIGVFMNLAVEQLTVTEGAVINQAVVQKLAAQMITASVLATPVDSSGRWAMMAADGFSVFGRDSDGNDMELVKLGPNGTDLLTVGKATIDGNGNISGQRIDARELLVGGQSLEEIVRKQPRGVIQQVLMPSSKIGAWAGSQETPQMEGFAWLPKGRAGRIESSPVTIEVTGGAIPWIKLNWMNGSGVAWRTVSEATSDSGYMYVTLPGMNFDLQPPSNDRLTGYSLTLTNRGPGKCRIITGAGGVRISLIDMGDEIPRGGTVFYNDTGGGGAPPAPPPEAPKRVTKRYNAIAWWGFWYNGNRDTSVNAPTQGQYSAGNRAAFFQFPYWGGDTAGANILRVTLCSYADHWYYGSGGTASWNVHRSTVANPSSWSQLNPSFVGDTTGWPRGADRRINLPSSMFSQVASGNIRGFGFATPTTGLSHYGKFSTDLSRTWLEIEMEK